MSSQPNHTSRPSSRVEALAEAVQAGDRRALARGITLIESQRADHRADAERLLRILAGSASGTPSLRIGLSGTPGVGKSTFIDGFGMHLLALGLKVAVLAVDPTSARSGGSILGDKTRMDRLAVEPGAFIRPSPAGGLLGGVAARTQEVISLVEAAGFDAVIVETVGVGQSETLVSQMTDVFLLLLAPGGGDELQGVKRGIMEVADLILINKADGDLLPAARRTCADYAGALRCLRRREADKDGFPKAMMVSALEGAGLASVWKHIETLAAWRKQKGFFEQRRKQQLQASLERLIHERLWQAFNSDEEMVQALQHIRGAIDAGHLTPALGAERAIEYFFNRENAQNGIK